MLLPDKHIRLCESILGLSAFTLNVLDSPKGLDALWNELQRAQEDKSFPACHGIDNLAIATSFLFSIGAVTDLSDGTVARCD